MECVLTLNETGWKNNRLMQINDFKVKVLPLSKKMKRYASTPGAPEWENYPSCCYWLEEKAIR
jgi:hypothetical protein